MDQSLESSMHTRTLQNEISSLYLHFTLEHLRTKKLISTKENARTAEVMIGRALKGGQNVFMMKMSWTN
jgi:hypothetical protein